MQKLVRFPEVLNLPTYTFVPKSLVRRYAVLATSVFEWWLKEASDGTDGDRARAVSLFLRVFDFAVTRDVRIQNKGNSLQETQKDEGVSVAKQIKSRIQRLEAGFWLAELEEALRDNSNAQEKAAERRVVAAAQDVEADSTRNLETCLFKVLNGGARTGRRVLESSGVHPASPITVDRMAHKFATNVGNASLTCFEKYKDQLKRCKVPIVEVKVVGKLIGGLKDCKASGGSGWRNSRLKAIASTPEGVALN